MCLSIRKKEYRNNPPKVIRNLQCFHKYLVIPKNLKEVTKNLD